MTNIASKRSEKSGYEPKEGIDTTTGQPDRPIAAMSLDFDAQLSIQYSFILKKEAANSSGTSVGTYQTTCRHFQI
jgi:hypothetical protein